MNYKNNPQQQQSYQQQTSYIKPKLSLGTSFKDNTTMSIYNTKNSTFTTSNKTNNEIDLVTISKTLPKSVKPQQNDGKTTMKGTILIVNSEKNQSNTGSFNSNVNSSNRYSNVSSLNNSQVLYKQNKYSQGTNLGQSQSQSQSQVNQSSQQNMYLPYPQGQSSQSIGPIMSYVRSGNNQNMSQSVIIPYSQNTYSNNSSHINMNQVNNQMTYSQNTVQQGNDMGRNNRINQSNQYIVSNNSIINRNNLQNESFISDKDDVIISSVSTLSLKSSSNTNKYSQNTVNTMKSSSNNPIQSSKNILRSTKNEYSSYGTNLNNQQSQQSQQNIYNQYNQMTYNPNMTSIPHMQIQGIPSQSTLNYSQKTINRNTIQQRETFTPLIHSQFSQNTHNTVNTHNTNSSKPTLNSSFSQNDKDKIDVQLNIEDLLLQEEKLSDIIQDLNSEIESSNSCYEWWSFFISSSSLAGNYEIFFKDEISKEVIKEHMLLEFVSVMICYDCDNHNLTKRMENKFRLVFYYIHQSMLLFSDYLLSKISSTCMNNIWVTKLKQLVLKHLKLIPTNKIENIRVIKYHNDNIIMNLKEVLNSHPGKETYLDTLYSYLNTLQSCSLIILSDIFRNKIIKFKNSKGSVLASSLPIEEISERRKLSCKVNPSISILDSQSLPLKNRHQSMISPQTQSNLINNQGLKAKTLLSNKSIERFSTWKTTGGFSTSPKIEQDEPEFNPSMARYITKNENKTQPQVSNTSIISKTENFQSTESTFSTGTLKDIKEEEEKKEIDSNSNNNSRSASGSGIGNEDKAKNDVVEVLVEAPYIKNSELTKKYCLVLDLDETLIHYKVDPSNSDDGDMLIRPYMFEFLNGLEKYYELILFTAGTEEVSKSIKYI